MWEAVSVRLQVWETVSVGDCEWDCEWEAVMGGCECGRL